MEVQHITLFAAFLFAPTLVRTATADPTLQELVCRAEYGDPAAQDRLGLCCCKGVIQNYTEVAVKWFHIAAEQEHERGKQNLRRLGL